MTTSKLLALTILLGLATPAFADAGSAAPPPAPTKPADPPAKPADPPAKPADPPADQDTATRRQKLIEKCKEAGLSKDECRDKIKEKRDQRRERREDRREKRQN